MFVNGRIVTNCSDDSRYINIQASSESMQKRIHHIIVDSTYVNFNNDRDGVCGFACHFLRLKPLS